MAAQSQKYLSLREAQELEAESEGGRLAAQSAQPDQEQSLEGRSSALNETISIHFQEATLDEALTEISKRTNLNLVYGSETVAVGKSVTLEVREATVRTVLDHVLEGTGLQSRVLSDGGLVVIEKRGAALKVKPREPIEIEPTTVGGVQSSYSSSWSDRSIQTGSIEGTVTDAQTGNSLPGVNVVVAGTQKGAATGPDGQYQISDIEAGTYTVRASFVGYNDQTRSNVQVRANETTTVDFQLTSATAGLEEVVVVGYGEQRQQEVTGAVGQVSGEEIQDVQTTNPVEALQGLEAGVQVSSGGSPGDSPYVRIRGLNSPNSNDPLVIVDGVEVGGLDAINSQNIESIEVLKDASAASIYGSRASGGVIVISTKGGQAGEMQVDFSSSYTTRNVHQRMDLLNTSQYVDFVTELNDNAGQQLPPRFSEEGFPSEFPNTDWQDAVLRRGAYYNANLAVSGGNENATYRMSGGYSNEQGTIIETGFERYNFRVNSSYTLDRFTFSENVAVSYRAQRPNQAGDPLGLAQRMPPYISVRDSDNLSGFGGITNADGADDVNPVRVQEWGYSRNNEVKVFGTLSAEMRIIDGLNLKTTIGGDLAENRSESFTPSYDTGFQQQDYASIAENRFTAFSRTWSTTLNFDRAFGSHNLSSTLGYEYQKDIFQSLSGDGKNNSTDLITTPAGIQEILSLSGSKSEDVLLSYFGRVNYNYDDRYLLEASLRRDGYSRFGPQNKWSLFPAASVGWNIARESFMTGLPVSQLKLRGSWGLTGNNNAIGAYEWQAGVTASSAGSPLVYAFGQDNSTIVNPTTILEIANPFLKWETTEQINVGVDLGLLENSFTLSANYFQNTTEDILLNIPLAPTLGFQGGTRANTGTVETSGFEFTAGYESQNPGEFNWSIQGNFSTNNNEVTDIGRGNPINLGDWAGSDLNPNRVEEGEPLFYFYGWKVDRLFTENDFRADGTLKDNIPTHQNDCADPTSCTSPGDIKFVDVNGDGQITPEDRTNLGSPHPDYYYGATATVDAYDFDLSATVQGTGGVNILQNYKYWTQGMTRVFNAESNVLDAWTPQNSDTSVPRAINGDPNRNARFSDRFVDDGDYLRLKRVTLGYTLPVERLGVSSTLSRARLYVQGANLLTFTGYEGYDPEVFQDPGAGATEDVGFGYDSGTYVQPRSFTVGVQMNF